MPEVPDGQISLLGESSPLDRHPPRSLRLVSTVSTRTRCDPVGNFAAHAPLRMDGRLACGLESARADPGHRRGRRARLDFHHGTAEYGSDAREGGAGMDSPVSADAWSLRVHAPPNVSRRVGALARLGTLLRQRRRLYRTPGFGGVGEIYRAARGARPGGDVRRRLPRVPSASPALARHAVAPLL